MDDTIYRYFAENIETVSKEELLEALRGVLESAQCWREACLKGGLSDQVGGVDIKKGQTA